MHGTVQKDHHTISKFIESISNYNVFCEVVFFTPEQQKKQTTTTTTTTKNTKIKNTIKGIM